LIVLVYMGVYLAAVGVGVWTLIVAVSGSDAALPSAGVPCVASE
jgi:hypothetical protein